MVCDNYKADVLWQLYAESRHTHALFSRRPLLRVVRQETTRVYTDPGASSPAQATESRHFCRVWGEYWQRQLISAQFGYPQLYIVWKFIFPFTQTFINSTLNNCVIVKLLAPSYAGGHPAQFENPQFRITYKTFLAKRDGHYWNGGVLLSIWKAIIAYWAIFNKSRGWRNYLCLLQFLFSSCNYFG